MRDFVKISPAFWHGKTAKKIAARGFEAQILAMYLISNRHTNYIGVYNMPLAYVAVDLAWPMERVDSALKALCEIGFAQYDYENEFVFVVEAGKHQLGTLKSGDLKIKSVAKDFERIPCGQLALDFYSKYAKDFHLEMRDDLDAFETAQIKSQAAAPSVNAEEVAMCERVSGYFKYLNEPLVDELKRLVGARNELKAFSFKETGELISKLYYATDRYGEHAVMLVVQQALAEGDYTVSKLNEQLTTMSQRYVSEI